MNRADVAVIGGGIVGLAYAWEAARRGKLVVLFERSPFAQAASVRNFGMIWPIGQPPGEHHSLALRSRARWLELRDQARLSVEECGSLHVSHEDDEDAVLREFAAKAPGVGIACTYLNAADVLRRFPSVNPDGLRGGLFSAAELCVNPRSAIAQIPKYLRDVYRVDVRFGTGIASVEMPLIRTAAGETWHVETAFVASGADFESLFPEVFAQSGLIRCKLQMLRTGAQPNGFRLGPHVAGGLTLCHYKSFEMCDSLKSLKVRVAGSHPRYVELGIHVMAAQNDAGHIVIGDSHEYGAAMSPFDKAEIDDLILAYLRRMIRLPEWEIAERWHGVYAKHPTLAHFSAEPQPGCHIVSSPGGAGMTLSFGLAERWWAARDSEGGKR